MPRDRAHHCHKCGKSYTGWRCPVCYKSNKRGRGANSGHGGRRGSRLRMQSVLASDQINGHAISDDDRLRFEECAPVDWRDAAQPPAPPVEQLGDRGVEIARSQDAIAVGDEAA
jgi:hypothetical protein